MVLQRITAIVLATVVWTPAIAGADEQTANFDRLVHQLDHQAFHSRSSASAALVSAGATLQADVAADVQRALRRGLQHPSLEVRIAVMEIHREIDQIRLDRQLACLVNPHCQTDSLSLPGWRTFSGLVGSDMPARRLYARVFSRFPNELRRLSTNSSKQDTYRLTDKLDPYRLRSQDTVGWTMLLVTDIQGPKTPLPKLTSRLAMALSNSTMGPLPSGQPDATVVGRVIEHWLRVHKNNCAPRERLLIAMRYGCHDLAIELCDQTFHDRSAPPSALVTALLSASVLGLSDIEAQARSRLDDTRTAHVWQLIAARKTKIRTQVRDVALALLLYQHGIDPRKAGFQELQADPILLYRDHSLGFPNEASRQESFVEAKRLIGLHPH